MESTRPAPATSPAAPDDTRRLELAVENMARAQRALADLDVQRRLIITATMSILVALSIVTFSLTGLGSVPWLAPSAMAGLALLARLTMVADFESDLSCRAELVESRQRELEHCLTEADRALDPTGFGGIDSGREAAVRGPPGTLLDTLDPG